VGALGRFTFRTVGRIGLDGGGGTGTSVPCLANVLLLRSAKISCSRFTIRSSTLLVRDKT
jgi:hypothetical protein